MTLLRIYHKILLYNLGNIVRAQHAPEEGGRALTTAHIHMRKTLFAIAAAILLIALSLGAFALSDASSIGFELTIDPTTLKEPGPVTVKATITNKGTEDITVPMTLYDADDKIVTAAFDGGVLSLLKAGESREYSGQWTVAQKHLDAGRFSFNLRLNTTDAAGTIAQVSIPASATIAFEGEKVELGITRSITPEVARASSTVTVSYELANKGTVKLTDIIVKENALIATRAQTVKELAPGATTKLTFEKRAGTADLESSAVVTYYREGARTQLRQTLDTVQIPIAKPAFSAELSADQTTVTVGDTVTLTLTMKNDGNIDYTGIKVSDARMGEVFTGLDLPAGQTLVQTKEINMMVPTTFRFSIALNDNTGTTQTQTTNEVKVSAYNEGQMMRLNAQLSADRETVPSLPGLVRMSVNITNDSNTAATPVTVYHGDLRIAYIETLAPGQSITVTREYNISQAGKYRFTVRTEDVLNNTVSFDTNEISIGFAPPTPEPTKQTQAPIAPVVTYSPIPVSGDDSTLAKGKNALFILTWAVGLLFAGTLGLFLASSFMRARARKQSDTAYDHLELQPKRDYADPETYQSEEAGAHEAEGSASASAATETARIKEEDLPHHKYLKEDAPKAAEPATVTEPDADETNQDESASEDGAYQMVREPKEETPAAQASKRKPRRRAAKSSQPLDEDDE